MNVTSTKQDRQFAESFIPIGEQLRASGFTDWEIVRIFRKQDKARRRQQADKASLYSGIGETILGVAEAFRGKTTNRIEIRYFDLLKSRGIKFKFQYKIAGYTVCFLIGSNLVFEIDGQDAAKDAQLERFGYSVLRVPEWLAEFSESAVLDSIDEMLKGGLKEWR